MKRRDFLKLAGGAAVAGAAFPGLLADGCNAAEPTTVNIQALFESDNPEVLALAQRVFDKCVLEKLRPPVEPLQHA